ncbi:hypothetical protein HPP92_017045 [Vanilla planifolia]|uniref:Uncharacterized protein n=1 Tax=Vanilla planifolia TaxID=51239 RepID=A0A835QC01_VANPL|nr:hypothetical protein HPP92_017045 [Vanilla planifolia]
MAGTKTNPNTKVWGNFETSASWFIRPAVTGVVEWQRVRSEAGHVQLCRLGCRLFH